MRIAFSPASTTRPASTTPSAAIANKPDLDLVLCLGDYIYEYSRQPGGRRLDSTGTNHDGDGQILEEYRQKYRLYKADSDLQAMHAAHPFLSVWDDHEVEDNYARRKAQLPSAEARP